MLFFGARPDTLGLGRVGANYVKPFFSKLMLGKFPYAFGENLCLLLLRPSANYLKLARCASDMDLQ